MSETFPEPFSRGHAAIWAALLAHAPWVALVRENNRINTAVNAYTYPKPPPADGDVPEFMVSQMNFNFPVIRENTMLLTPTQDYTLLITTDRINWSVANQIKYQTFAALLSAGPSLGTNCLIGAWQLSGSDAQSSTAQREAEVPMAKFRATVIGKLTLTFNLNKPAIINPATTY